MESVQPRPPVEYLPENPSVAIVVNPASSGAGQLYKQIRTLMGNESYTAGSIYRTVPGGLEANREGLLRLLCTGPGGLNEDGTTRRYDAVLVLGGDGAGDMVANFLAGHPDLPEDIQHTVIIEGNNGGAGDGHKTRFGRSKLNLAALGGLPIVKHYPLRTEITRPDGETETYWTNLYQSLGFTGLTAELLNGPEYRNSWLHGIPGGKTVKQYLTGLRSLAKSRSFTVNENGEERTINELVVSNNRRMGNLPLFPGDATVEGTFPVMEISGKANILKNIGRLVLNRSEWQERKELDMFVVGSDDNDPSVPSQRAGEHDRLPPGTRVRVTKEDKRYLRYAAPGLVAARAA